MIYKLIRYLVRNTSVFVSTCLMKIHLKYSGCNLPMGMKIDGIVFWKVNNKGRVYIGSNFILNSRSTSNLVGITNRASFQIIANGKIEIGDNCGFTSTVLSSRSLIKIGNYVKIGGNVRIYDHDYHSLNYINRRNTDLDSLNVKTAAIIIDDDVFIGTNSIILKGVRIGARSIIGAGSIVSLKNIPPDSIVAGNPARILKSTSEE